MSFPKILSFFLILFLSLLLLTGCTMLPSIQTYTLTATSSPGGSISPEGELTVNQGASQTFTCTPDTGYQIADILVDGVSIGIVAEYTFQDVQGDHTIQANFTELTYTLIATSGENGTIIPQGEVIVNQGASKTFTITPDEAYEILDVLIEGRHCLFWSDRK